MTEQNRCIVLGSASWATYRESRHKLLRDSQPHIRHKRNSRTHKKQPRRLRKWAEIYVVKGLHVSIDADTVSKRTGGTHEGGQTHINGHS